MPPSIEKRNGSRKTNKRKHDRKRFVVDYLDIRGEARYGWKLGQAAPPWLPSMRLKEMLVAPERPLLSLAFKFGDVYWGLEELWLFSHPHLKP